MSQVVVEGIPVMIMKNQLEEIELIGEVFGCNQEDTVIFCWVINNVKALELVYFSWDAANCFEIYLPLLRFAFIQVVLKRADSNFMIRA